MSPAIAGVSAYLRLSRLSNAILPALAVIAGAAATGKNIGINTVSALLSLVLLHSLVTIWNDIRDEATDKLNGIHRIEAIRHQRGMPALYACMGLSLVAVTIFMSQLTAALNGLLVGFVVLGWLYNDKPLQASRRPILSVILMGLSYGLVPFLIGTGLTGMRWEAIVLAAGWTCVRTSLSLMKDYKDAPGDAKAGKKTFLLVFGHTWVARLSFGLALAGYIAILVGVIFLTPSPLWAGVTLSGLAAWLLSERTRMFRMQEYGPLNQLFHNLLTYEILFIGLLIAWLRTS